MPKLHCCMNLQVMPILMSLNSISNSYSQDIGGTWYEAGLGFNFKTTDNSYVYADVVKTFGDDIKTPWQWNVGARWSF